VRDATGLVQKLRSVTSIAIVPTMDVRPSAAGIGKWCDNHHRAAPLRPVRVNRWIGRLCLRTS
jgi:hypothetical protein